MSYRDLREMAPREATTWLEVREGAIAWLAADRPEWRTVGGAKPGRPILSRIIADTGINKNTVLRIHAREGLPGPASIDGTRLARLLAVAAKERGATPGQAFDAMFLVPELEKAAA